MRPNGCNQGTLGICFATSDLIATSRRLVDDAAANACFVPTENLSDLSIERRLKPPIVDGRQQSLTTSVNT
jgi:hypothetical protein